MWSIIVALFIWICQSQFFKYLRRLAHGHIVVRNAAKEEHHFGDPNNNDLCVTITIHNEVNFYWRILTRWDLGFGMLIFF